MRAIRTTTLALMLATAGLEGAAVAGEDFSGMDSVSRSASGPTSDSSIAALGNSRYYFISASGAFSAVYSQDAYSYSGGGCLGNPTGSLLDWVADLQVESGETITAVRFYFRDDNADEDVSLSVFKIDTSGDLSFLGSGVSAGTPGHSFITIPLNHVVNNETGAVFVRALQHFADETEVCGIRVETTS